MNPTVVGTVVIASFLVCLNNVLDVVYGAPIHPPTKVPPSKEMLDYMKKYGYLRDGGADTEALYTEKAFQEAIKEMQSYGGVPQTGQIDNATLRLLTTPRCGVPDKIDEETSGNRTKRYAIGSRGWKKKHLTYFLANWAQEMNPDEAMKILKKSFKVWSDITPLSFKHIRSMEADIVVFFARGYHGDSYPFDGTGNILAHAFFPYEHGTKGGDIHFDDDEKWIDKSISNQTDGIDLFTVATHEIGHSLGIAHSREPNSVMFPYYKGYDKHFRVDYDDVLATYELYVANNNFEDEVKHRDSPRTVPLTPDDDDDEEEEEDDTNDPFAPRRGVPTVATSRPGHGHTPRARTKPPTIPTYNPHGITPSGRGRTTGEPVGHPRHDGERKRASTPKGKTKPPTITPLIPDKVTTSGRHQPKRPTRPPTIPTYIPPTKIPRQDHDTPKKKNPARSPIIPSEVPPRAPLNPRPTPEDRTKIPNICEGSFDSVSFIRGELFVFKGEFMWRLRDRGVVVEGYPTNFHNFFTKMPWSVKKIDAIYQRPDDHIVLFSGKHYWIFDGRNLDKGSPQLLQSLGFPRSVDHIDAAFTWGKNGKTYFFKDSLYWRYDEEQRTMETGYPLEISERWKGVPDGIDTAFTWRDGLTYFFKGLEYWRFDNEIVHTGEQYPRYSTIDWLGCED